jgi:hypothetical protein
MRMSRDVEIVAATIFSMEKLEDIPIGKLSDLELEGAPQHEIERFKQIVCHIEALPVDIQYGLSAVATLAMRKPGQERGV